MEMGVGHEIPSLAMGLLELVERAKTVFSKRVAPGKLTALQGQVILPKDEVVQIGVKYGHKLGSSVGGSGK